MVSGQKVNLEKPSIYFSKGVSNSHIVVLSAAIHIPSMNDFKTYLGFMVLHKRKNNHRFTHLVDKVRKKLTNWKGFTLSSTSYISMA